MADVADRRGEGGLATELPSKYLPGVEYRDLPEAQGLRKYLGASVILTAYPVNWWLIKRGIKEPM